jgi:hypothetical protein
MTHDRDVWPPPSTLGPPARLRPRRRSIARLAHGVLATRILALLVLPGLFAVCAIDLPLAAETHRTGRTDGSTEAELSEALARHPEPARRAALLIAGEPEALLEIDRVQQESARRFAELIASRPKSARRFSKPAPSVMRCESRSTVSSWKPGSVPAAGSPRRIRHCRRPSTSSKIARS